MSYAALGSFFNDILRNKECPRMLPLNLGKLRSAGDKYGVKLFTNDWGLRTRVPGTPVPTDLGGPCTPESSGWLPTSQT